MASKKLRSRLEDINTDYIAIHLGNKTTGVAVWSRRNSRVEVFTNTRWNPGEAGIAVKTPTVLLLDNLGHFVAFGLKAIKLYQSMYKQGLDTNYYYFKDFLTRLSDEKV